MLRRTLASLAVVLCLSPAAAHALFGTPGPGDRLLQPPSQYFLPMEAGALDSHADIQLLYTMYTIGLGPLGESKTNVVQLGVDGQLAILDRFQVGVNIPFLNYNGSDFGAVTGEGTHFGNMLVRLKFKVLGSSSGPFALSVFTNILLPTASGIDHHDFAAIQPGAAFSLGISRFALNADLSFYEAFSSDANGLTGLMLNLHAAVKVLFLAPYVGFQFAEPMAGTITDIRSIGHTPGVALSAGVQFIPLSFIHIDLGTRIALDDAGKLLYGAGLGRATLVFGAGVRF